MSLHDIQTKVHVAKDKRNDFGGYNYRTAEGILSALKASLPDGWTVLVTDEIRECAGQIFVSACASIRDEKGAEVATASGHAMHPLTKKGMDPSQITGAASSYARKYALSGLLALDDGSVDPDAANEGYEEDKPKFDPAGARDRIKRKLEGAQTMAALADAWKEEWPVIQEIQAAKPPMFAEIEAVKNNRKTALTEQDAA